ncbi:MAG: hypothetical protein EOO13_05340 [Chitinophagaceae bacterium]|nr:MAG: hypothetical protein EOO13_05340 [Chitinophagaceae bacterium]
MKIKNIGLLMVAVMLGTAAFAQDEDEKKPEKEHGFKKENLFTGGTVNVQFGNRFTSLGIGPYFGYSVNKYLDVAAAVNFNYTSERISDFTKEKVRQTIYGPSAFVRIFPVKFLFAHAQYEFNFLKVKYIPGSGFPNEKYSTDAHSFLIGPGYAGGRGEDNKSFYYISVLWDVGSNINSPYKDVQNRAVPVIRAGYNIALFQGR